MTRYDFFRRRIAPILFLVVVGLIAYDACSKQERTHATIVLDFGDSAPRVRSVDAELTVAGQVIGMFHRVALSGSSIGPCKFEAALPEQAGELRIDVELAGARKHLVRRIQADEGATVTVPLAVDLQ
ncbi:MAG: hypothetical protein H6Q90_348 [Deltaproteobacteria bacterium]|nr:hypothetical protein [Deltaproteobacteria bacterium]